MKNSLTPGQTAVLRAFNDFGRPMDDTALSVFVHHIEDEDMSSSGVRSRRAELCRAGLVGVVGTKVLKSGRRAAIHDLTPQGKRLARALFARATA